MVEGLVPTAQWTHSVGCKSKSLNAVQGNNNCSFWYFKGIFGRT